jgi:hypothetical protein
MAVARGLSEHAKLQVKACAVQAEPGSCGQKGSDDDQTPFPLPPAPSAGPHGSRMDEALPHDRPA